MFKRLLAAIAVFFLIGPDVTRGQGPTPTPAGDGCSIHARLNAEFRKRNPDIAHVRVVDVRPTLTEVPKYLVLGWGIRADRTFRGKFDDELFGLFLFDEALSSVEKVFDFIPTPRWHDTEVRITRVDASRAVLEARGETYGGRLLRREYDLSKEGRTPRRVATAPPERVSFPTEDGGLVHADLYGEGMRGVVLAPGGRFNKESWAKQARVLAGAGFRVLAIDFRGSGQSRGGTRARDEGVRLDVLAAVRYLRGTGAKTVSVVGASFGGGAAAEASAEAGPGEIDRLILLAHSPVERPELMKGRKLFILSRDDSRGDDKTPRLPEIRDQYERAPGPKELVLLDGSAHAQFIFETGQGERLMREILRFLSEP